jgi:leader peptidase (prepilin peptidase)/N-methyltransferase
MIQLLIANLFFAVWSRLLNYAGTALLFSEHILRCFSCKRTISAALCLPFSSSSCSCGQPLLYQPTLLTLLGMVIFNLIYFFQHHSFIAAFLFCSCLLINIRTDAETSLLSRFVTIYSAPFFLAAGYFDQLPVSFIESATGLCLGYGLLWLVRWLFFLATGRTGLGMGDLELLALIGAFLGPLGAWFSILLGSILGTVFILTQTAVTDKKIYQIAFGPFLSISAITYLILEQTIIDYVFFFN